MILKRKIDTFLTEWKNTDDRKPLIIKGQRQIGKTYSIKLFIENNYKNYIYVNFSDDKKIIELLRGNSNAEYVISILENYYKTKLLPHKSIVFFDEAQEYMDIITSLKSFKLQGLFDVIVSGSNLGYFLNKVTLLPLGYSETYEMKSLDFEEFLWAKGIAPEYIQSIIMKMQFISPLSIEQVNLLEGAFQEYITIGALPAVVTSYLENNGETIKLLSEIEGLYLEDVTRYIKGIDRLRINTIINFIPRMLASENKKFTYSKISSSARQREYMDAFFYLREARIISTCYKIKTLKIPLKGFLDENSFKIYHSDQGILLNLINSDLTLKERLDADYGIYKGGLIENAVAGILDKQNFDLMYFRNSSSTLELDFVIQHKNLVIPIEVKANSGNAKSLKFAMQDKNNNISFGIKLTRNNISLKNNVYNFPIYLAPFLYHFIKFIGKDISHI